MSSYGGRPRPPVGGEVYWLRSVPAAYRRAGREGHVWPWNPTSPRRRAFHSSVPLRSSPPTYPAPTYPASFKLLPLASFYLALLRFLTMSPNSLSLICFFLFLRIFTYLSCCSQLTHKCMLITFIKYVQRKILFLIIYLCPAFLDHCYLLYI